VGALLITSLQGTIFSTDIQPAAMFAPCVKLIGRLAGPAAR
jgi:hypothetical protein